MRRNLIKRAVSRIDKFVKSNNQQILRELDCFVLDNSLRESTVSQLRGHTVKDKKRIYNEIKKCGYENIVVAAFSDEGRVDDVFVRQLFWEGEDMSKLYSFVDFMCEGKDSVIDREKIPATLLKMEELSLQNPIIEIDMANKRVDWREKRNLKEMCSLLLHRIEWIKEHLSPNAKIFINLRDFPHAMEKCPHSLLKFVKFIGSLDGRIRPLGLMYEEPTGNFLPELMTMWTRTIREVMNSVGWKAGHLLVHVHQNWGLAEAVQLDCLKAGASGIWASVCEEGAAFGHACSSITLMNLIRMGNTKVLDRYNCKYLRQAAIEVTKITTGSCPHPRQCLYGERALDFCFDFSGIAGGKNDSGDFDMADFFGEKKSIRISTLASTDMVLKQMIRYFGTNPDFTVERASVMKRKIVEDLIDDRKEEYMSPVGLALLFGRAGGHLNDKMREVIDKWEITIPQWKLLMHQLRSVWDELDATEEVSKQGDNSLEFATFFKGYLQPYFSSLRCEDARKAFKALDMNGDGKVDWSEFMVYIKWAIFEYPNIYDTDELLSVAFQNGLLPALMDEVLTPMIDNIQD